VLPRSDDLQAALYARVSSDHQAEAGTIASQVEALEERLRADGLRPDPELYFLDDGYTGATLVRPALERLRDVAAAGGVDRIYVHCPDRLARHYAYQFLLVEEFQQCGVEVVFLNHAFDDSPEHNMLLQVQGVIAEYERAKILERCRRGRLHAARQGSVSVLGKSPYGYQYITRDQGGGEARYEIVLEEGRIVREIFAWVGQEGVSLRGVCTRLNARGIPTRCGKARWHPATVCGMLKNPAYRGLAAFGKTRAEKRRPPLRPARGSPEYPRYAKVSRPTPPEQWISIPVPALVSEELFAAVQERLAENRRRNRRRRTGARYLLQGLVVCKQCGYAYTGKRVGVSASTGRGYSYYRCLGTEADRFAGQRVCSNRQVRAREADEAVWQDVCELLSQPQRLEEEYQRRLEGDNGEKVAGDVKQLKQTIRKVKRGIGRLIDAYEGGWIEKAEFEPRIATARRRLDGLRAELETSRDEASQRASLRLAIGQLQQFRDQVSTGLQEAAWPTRRKLIETLIKQVEIDSNGLQIVYRVNPTPFDRGPERGIWPHCLCRPLGPPGLVCRLVGARHSDALLRGNYRF